MCGKVREEFVPAFFLCSLSRGFVKAVQALGEGSASATSSIAINRDNTPWRSLYRSSKC